MSNFNFNFSSCQIYKAFFKPNVDRYVLLVAVGPTIIGLALALMIRPYSSEGFGESNRANTQWRFQLTYVSSQFQTHAQM